SAFFLFYYTSPTELYPLSLHDALPILPSRGAGSGDPAYRVTLVGRASSRRALEQSARLWSAPVPWRFGITRGKRQGTAAVQNALDRKSTRLNSSHVKISYAVFCLKKKK